MHIQEPDFSEMIRKSDSARKNDILQRAQEKSSKEIIKEKIPKEVLKEEVTKEKIKETPIIEVLKKTSKPIFRKNTSNTSGLIYTVQIAALDHEDKKYNAINNVIKYNENSLVKYGLGSFKTFKEANQYRKKINKKYKGAFVKALKNNVPVQLNH